MKIDFVSDIACPWCVVGLYALEEALRRVGPDVPVELHFQPFELNPQMPPEGEDAAEHIARKYGASPAQLAQTREALRQRGAELGFEFGARARVWNTFDAHRLLHWAGLEGRQAELKHALLKAYHQDGLDPGKLEVLLPLCAAAGLDGQRAREILQGDEFAEAVRESERYYQERGITAVPSVIIDDKHLIQGGQPPEAFEAALRKLATPN